MPLHFRSLLIACYYGYFVIGLLLTIIGPIIPALRQDFGLSLSQVGLMFVAQSAGFALAVFTGGATSDAVGRRPILLLGATFFAVGLLGFFVAVSWLVALFFFFLTGIGFGFAESALNSLAVDLSPGDEGKALNLLHLFPAAGAVVGPYVASSLLGFGWRVPLAVVGLLMAIFLIWLLCEAFPPPASATAVDWRSLPAVVGNPVVLTLAIVMALYVGAENAISGWTVSYVVEAFEASSLFGALVTSLFWIGLMIGRVACGRIATKVGYLKVVMFTGLGGAIAYIPAVILDQPVLIALCIGATGIFFGGVFPTVIAHASVAFPRQVGSVTGVLIAACSIGGAGVPAAVGVVADWQGMRFGLSAVIAAVVLMVGFTALAQRLERSPLTRARPVDPL